MPMIVSHCGSTGEGAPSLLTGYRSTLATYGEFDDGLVNDENGCKPQDKVRSMRQSAEFHLGHC